MATSLKLSEKEDRIDHLQFNAYQINGAKIVKISPADPEILRLWVNKSGMKQNWLQWQRHLTNRKNWTWSIKFTQISSIWCKDRENWSSWYWDSFAHSKKKLMQAKYIALPASLPSVLNKIDVQFLLKSNRVLYMLYQMAMNLEISNLVDK